MKAFILTEKIQSSEGDSQKILGVFSEQDAAITFAENVFPELNTEVESWVIEGIPWEGQWPTTRDI